MFTMNRTGFFFFLAILFAPFVLTAQTGGMLSAADLERMPIYYSLEQALRDTTPVYKLSLEGQKLKEIPPEVFTLTHLQYLNLSNNKIGSIPSDISKLDRLQFLNLSNNKIRYIPNEISALIELQILYLGRNRLTEVSVWIGGLGKLRRLDLSLNHLTPYEIQRVKYFLPRCTVTP